MPTVRMASNLEEYDFIIIGGGTSGLVLEDRSTQVLVLEAGGNHLNNPNVRMPALCGGNEDEGLGILNHGRAPLRLEWDGSARVLGKSAGSARRVAEFVHGGIHWLCGTIVVVMGDKISCDNVTAQLAILKASNIS